MLGATGTWLAASNFDPCFRYINIKRSYKWSVSSSRQYWARHSIFHNIWTIYRVSLSKSLCNSSTSHDIIIYQGKNSKIITFFYDISIIVKIMNKNRVMGEAFYIFDKINRHCNPPMPLQFAVFLCINVTWLSFHDLPWNF